MKNPKIITKKLFTEQSKQVYKQRNPENDSRAIIAQNTHLELEIATIEAIAFGQQSRPAMV